MPEFEVKLRKNFTVMSNHHLQNKALSLKAKGLLSYMLSLPDDWDYSIGGLAANNKEGRAAVRSALVELEDAGYLIRSQCRSECGGFAGNRYIVYEIPHQDTDDYPLCENCTTDETAPPLCDFASAGNPSAENRTQLNTNLQNTKLIKPPKAPQGGRRRRESKAKSQPGWKPERFAKFWAFYPRGESKQAAINAWDKLKPDDALIDTMATALVVQTQREDWKRGVGIPYASTWLNQRRWEDETKVNSPAPDTVGNRGFVEREEVPIW